MFLVFTLFTSLMSFAYIPEYGLIASRTAENHGRGVYVIETEVTYKRECSAGVEPGHVLMCSAVPAGQVTLAL